MEKAGNVVIRGSALRSRGIEKYLREFLSVMLKLILEGKGGEVYTAREEFIGKLAQHKMGISWLAKTETLTESPDSYRQKIAAKKRNPAATYELALEAGRDYRAGDQVSYYVTGKKAKVRVYDHARMTSSYNPDHPDENVAYYQAKLDDLIKKFKDFLPADPAARKKGRRS
jgi:DNA polymerase elongation subunit (family B)